MTEAEWLLSEDPAAMLDFALGNNPPRPPCPSPPPSERKLRLFAAACARQSWHLLTDGRSRRAVEVAELYADGAAAEGERQEASYRALRVGGTHQEVVAWACVADTPAGAVTHALGILTSDRAAQAALLREIVGNPFRPTSLPGGPEGVCPWCGSSGVYESVILRPGALYPCGACDGGDTDGKPGPCPWLTPTAVRIAAGIYADRDFAALPVLADALEEAGCEEEGLLTHLRGKDPCPACLGSRYVSEKVHVPDPPYMHRMIPHFEDRDAVCLRCGFTGWVDAGPHALGCWALDAVLGRS